MDRIDILEQINRYFVDDDGESSKQEIARIMNSLVADESYKDNLDLFFMAISLTQLYGFLSYLSQDEKDYFYLSDYFRTNSYSSKNLGFLNSGQLSLLNEIDLYKKVFISAPTSFGKTSIVNEYVLNKLNELNLVIYIVPTNSLLEELYIKYSNFLCGIKEINISTQPILKDSSKNILFLTPERFLSLFESEGLDRVDLIVMDESYKIMDFKGKAISDFINTRDVRFRKVADIIGQANCKTIYLSPFTYTLTKSMERFLNKYQIKKIDRRIEYVSHARIKIETQNDFKENFPKSTNRYNTQNISKRTASIILELRNEKNIVYVKGYSDAYKIAEEYPMPENTAVQLSRDNLRFEKFLEHLNQKMCIDDKNKWKVISCLEKGIGIYISPVPRYIKREIIKLFEDNFLHTLIVTTSFTEGVNTNAKNLIFTTLVNGNNQNKLTSIDVLNVAGRAGRFGKSSIGNIYCISQLIFDKVTKLQNENVIELENYNYYLNSEGNPRGDLIDFEIDMVGNQYLTEEEKNEKIEIDNLMSSHKLTRKDLNISLNVSNKWKLYLYDFFVNSSTEDNNKYYAAILNLLDDNHKVNSIEIIFKAIAKCFKAKNDVINPFPMEIYEINPFDKSGEFTWGRLYGFFVSGTSIEVIRKNKRYIQNRYKEIMNGDTNISKDEIKQKFFDASAFWILSKYYKNDFKTPNSDAFYTEAFRFISNIIQYKIPFYLSYFVSVFKLYVIKNNTSYDMSKIDLTKIVMAFEDGVVSNDDFRLLIDYGVSNDVIMKIKENDITIESILSRNYNKEIFDDFEQLLLEDFAQLMNK